MPPPNPQPPQAIRSRGRGRGRGRGRNRPQAGMTGGQPSSGITQSSSNLVIRDTEILGTTTGSLQTFSFNPGVEGTPRLKSFERMYGRYRFNYVNIAYKSGSATNVAGNIAVGVLPGMINTTIKTQDDILRLKPSFYVPIWKNEQLSLNKFIDSQRFMLSGSNDNDGISFTLYVLGTQSGGMIQVSYQVEFAYPRPF